MPVKRRRVVNLLIPFQRENPQVINVDAFMDIIVSQTWSIVIVFSLSYVCILLITNSR